MLYKSPGPHRYEGGSIDYITVPEADVDAYCLGGWFRHPHDAMRDAAHRKQDGEGLSTAPGVEAPLAPVSAPARASKKPASPSEAEGWGKPV